MNRREFLLKLSENDVVFFRNGANHDIFVHSPSGKKVAIPRHREYANLFLKRILKEIPQGLTKNASPHCPR